MCEAAAEHVPPSLPPPVSFCLPAALAPLLFIALGVQRPLPPSFAAVSSPSLPPPTRPFFMRAWSQSVDLGRLSFSPFLAASLHYSASLFSPWIKKLSGKYLRGREKAGRGFLMHIRVPAHCGRKPLVAFFRPLRCFLANFLIPALSPITALSLSLS